VEKQVVEVFVVSIEESLYGSAKCSSSENSVGKRLESWYNKEGTLVPKEVTIRESEDARDEEAFLITQT